MMKKFTFLQFVVLLCVLLITLSGRAQEPQWTNLLQLNTYGFPSVNVVAADAGNVYMAGSVVGPITFEGKDYTATGNADLLITKITNAGVLVWDKQFNAQTGGVINANALKTDVSGNIYLSGTFTGTITIGSSTITSGATTNAFLAKLDAAGNGVWAASFQYIGTGSSKIALDNNGNAYLLSASSKLIKFSNAGLKLWEQSYPDRTLQAIVVSGSGLFVGGALQQSTTNFGSLILTKAGGYNGGYLVKADLDGVFSSSVVAGLAITGDGSAVADIAVNSSGDLLITGGCQGNIQLGDKFTTGNVSASRYTFIAKCNSDLTFAWLKCSSALTDNYRSIWTYRIFQDNLDNIYQLGMNSALFSYGSATFINYGDQFLFKFDANGNAIMGYALQNTSFNRSIVIPEGKLVSGGAYTAEGSYALGNFYLIKFSDYSNAEWQKVSSNSSLAGTATINNIKHDDKGNTYVRARIIGNCDYFGTTVNTNKWVTIISKHDITGNLLWMNKIPDINPSQIGQTFTIDNDNNILTVGLFKSSLAIGNTTLTSTNTGNEGYVAKYSTDGTLMWAEKFNLGKDVSSNITLSPDKAGNVIVALVINPANYLLKFNGSGTRLWTKSFPMQSYYLALVSTDATNNIYLASEIHLDNSTGTTTIGTVTLNQSTSDGSSSLIKFDPDGNAIWAKTYGSVAGASYTDGWPGDMATDSDGNTYIYGWCPNNAAFGTTTLSNPLPNSTYSLYLTKINTSGDVLWAKAVYQKVGTYVYGDLLDIDKQGNAYLGAHFRDKINIDGTEYTSLGAIDFFTAKFSNSGDFKWIKTIPNNSAITSLSVMADNIVTVAGNAGKNTMLGNFNVIQKSGSNCIIATMAIPNVMTGHINDHTSSPVTSGFVKLYKLNGNQAASMADSVAIQADGSYTMQNIPNSDFILYAEAASQVYPDYIGTYSGNVALWTTAMIINFTSSVQSDYDIKLIMIPVQSGSGQISGTVISDNGSAGKSNGFIGSPLVSVPVILVDRNAAAGTDSIVAIVKTNNLGEYIFPNVPVGNYTIRIEIPGLDMIERHEVELTAAKPNAEKMNYRVTSTGIVLDSSGETGIIKGENAGISISPNPVKSILFISGITQKSIVAIFDLKGQMLIYKQNSGNQIDVSKLANGIYSLRVTDNRGTSVRKLVKQ